MRPRFARIGDVRLAVGNRRAARRTWLGVRLQMLEASVAVLAVALAVAGCGPQPTAFTPKPIRRYSMSLDVSRPISRSDLPAGGSNVAGEEIYEGRISLELRRGKESAWKGVATLISMRMVGDRARGLYFNISPFQPSTARESIGELMSAFSLERKDFDSWFETATGGRTDVDAFETMRNDLHPSVSMRATHIRLSTIDHFTTSLSFYWGSGGEAVPKSK